MNILSFTINFFSKKTCTPEEILLLECSVTTEKRNEKDNYERLELLGDKLLQTYFVTYCFTTPPYNKMFSLKYGENICTRLNIKYLSTQYIVKMCNSIDLQKYIKMSPNETKSFEQIQEDVFEAWIGACSFIFDHNELKSVLFNIFNNLKIDLSFESCFDVKTRMNDFASIINTKFINLGTKYVENTDEYHTQVYLTKYPTIFGNGYSKFQRESENLASQDLFQKIKKVCPNFEDMYKKTKNYQNWIKFKQNFITCENKNLFLKKKIKRLI